MVSHYQLLASEFLVYQYYIIWHNLCHIRSLQSWSISYGPYAIVYESWSFYSGQDVFQFFFQLFWNIDIFWLCLSIKVSHPRFAFRFIHYSILTTSHTNQFTAAWLVTYKDLRAPFSGSWTIHSPYGSYYGLHDDDTGLFRCWLHWDCLQSLIQRSLAPLIRLKTTKTFTTSLKTVYNRPSGLWLWTIRLIVFDKR